MTRLIYIDPAYKAYYKDRLFDESDKYLNRDDTLEPFIRLQAALQDRGIKVHTADFLFAEKNFEIKVDYYSFGVIEKYKTLANHSKVSMRAFIIFEPPVVAPQLYGELPHLTKVFERVYIHNVEGDGYSLKGVDTSKLIKFYWPQPRNEVIESIWNRRNRHRRVVVINGNHKPKTFHRELYSKRIEAIASLAKLDAVDLYGRGWERWWSRSSMWIPYFCNRKILMSVYKGACESKYSVLGNYEFALCFENMAMNGYVTEKIFDCFYAGTIPLYWGAPDITDLIPGEAYIDVRNFATWEEMYQQLMSMSKQDVDAIRDAGKEFIRSKQGMKFYEGLAPIFKT